jgi:hypothetical protein
MLTAEIKINGILIGHLYIHNEVKEFIDPDGIHPYSAEYYEVGSGEIKRALLPHRRSDGALTLIAKVIKALKIKK